MLEDKQDETNDFQDLKGKESQLQVNGRKELPNIDPAVKA